MAQNKGTWAWEEEEEGTTEESWEQAFDYYEEDEEGDVEKEDKEAETEGKEEKKNLPTKEEYMRQHGITQRKSRCDDHLEDLLEAIVTHPFSTAPKAGRAYFRCLRSEPGKEPPRIFSVPRPLEVGPPPTREEIKSLRESVGQDDPKFKET